MIQRDLEIINSVIKDFLCFKEKHENQIINYLNDIFENFTTINDALIENFISNNNDITTTYLYEAIRLKKENKKNSYWFNSLRFFKIGETQHSFLLAKLLDPNAEHGQEKLFLEIFLSQIGISYNENDEWIVTPETARIDIMIKRKHPHSVIVIENKSNNADDQENQLYRYWYREMYLPNKEKDYRHTFDNTKNYRLIYLSPDKNKFPKEKSLLKPIWLEDPHVPQKLERKDILEWQFNKEVIEWLERCLPYLAENHRLREYVKQYIELWKN